MVIVDMQAVSKQYQNMPALCDLNLSIKAGEVLGLFGHNGAGKTTTIKLLLGVIKPSAGQVRVFDTEPAGAEGYKLRRKIGFLQENVSFYQQMTGREVLEYLAKLKGASLSQSNQLIEQVGLKEAADRRVKTYSKGMCQRLGLAQALLGEPRLLLLDEPTVGLDPIATRDFYRGLQQLKASGTTIILCSHSLSGVEKVIDRALILKQGKVLAAGDIDQLRHQADLPIRVSLYGDDLHLPTQIDIEHRRTGSGIECLLPHQQKMQLLPMLTALPGLKNIDLQVPALDDLYAHFNTANEEERHD